MGYRILLVDDSATMRAMIRRTIGLAGLDVEMFFEAGHGVEALALLRREHVDLVLADLHMPVMNGVDLARAVLSDPALSSVRLAVISAEPSAGKLLELKRAGVRGALRKPCTPEALRDLITSLLEPTHVAQH